LNIHGEDFVKRKKLRRKKKEEKGSRYDRQIIVFLHIHYF
jgi:hypothetical protein